MAGEPFSEDELLDYVRGAAPPGLAERIEAMMARDRGLSADVALMRGLKPALEEADRADVRQPPGELGWRRLEKAIGQDEAGRSPPSRRQMTVWRIAAAFLGIAVLGQAGYIAVTSTAVDRVAYRTASEAVAEHVLGIGFAPGATAAEIAALLQDANARVIDGPSALGLYRVAFPSQEALKAAEARFRASPLVDLVAEA